MANTNIKAELDAALERVKGDINKAVVIAAESIGEGLVLESTVDSGLFAANWTTDVNRRDKKALTHGDFGKKAPTSPYGSPGRRVISEDEALSVAKDIPNFELGDEITWSNNVPYLEEFDPIADLDFGTERGEDLARKRLKGL